MPLLAAAILTMSAAQLLDLVTFISMVRAVGPAAEANPLVAFLFGTYGFPMVAIAKITLLALTTGIAAVLARPPARWRIVATIVVLGTLVGIVGGVSNTIATTPI